jgi:hypothetical protein
MSNRTLAIDAVHRALLLCKGLGAQSPSSKLGVVGERVRSLFRALDGLIGYLPDPTPDEVVEDVDRIVDALHQVDRSWPACGDELANQRLDLAAARLRRLVARCDG